MNFLSVRYDAPADGPSNMAFDELLADEAKQSGHVVMRIYSWTEPTISLGAFQRYEDALSHPQLSRMTFVRRPSGGGAILHGTDMTYAIAVPKQCLFSSRVEDLYTIIHEAMRRELGALGLRSDLCGPASSSAKDVDEPIQKPDAAFLCFDRRSTGDLLVAHYKVMGSAQRRHATVVVQHGSLLVKQHPAGGGPGIQNLLEKPLDCDRLLKDWIERVGEALKTVIVCDRGKDPEPVVEQSKIVKKQQFQVVRQRYCDPRWTQRR